MGYLVGHPCVICDNNMKYKNILIKFSGESFGKIGQKVDLKKVQKIVDEVKLLRKAKIKVAVVCGGGNVSRWKDVRKGDRIEVDIKGMKGTLKNVYPLEKLLKKSRIPVQVYTSFSIKSKYPNFKYSSVKKDWQKGKIIIFAGGTGHPFFTTDTAAILRSLEVQADLFIKATKVDGVYTADPKKNSSAKKIKKISYKKIIENQLKIIDATAVCLAWENNLPIAVIKWEEGNVVKVVGGKSIGSLISER